MIEAPNVITLSPITLKYENKIYEIDLSQKSNNFFIKCKEIDSFHINQYEHEFSFFELIKISKFFSLFDNISSIIIELRKTIEENKIKITVYENYLNIIIDVEFAIIDEFFLQLEKKDDDLNSNDKNINKFIKEQKGIINKMNNELKCKIDKLDKKYNNKINRFNEKLNNKINKLNEESNKIIKKLEEEKKESNNKIKQLENEINEFKEKLLPLNEEKMNEEDFDSFKESKILKNINEKIMISNFIKINSKIKFTLLYQVSRDGDRISTFFNKVKDKFPTLIIIKSKSGFKFGGYTSIPWDQTGKYKSDELAFIFSLDKKKKYTIKNNETKYAIYGYSYRFAFGSGFDFSVYDHCTKKNDNYCNTPYSYNTNQKSELTGGQYNYVVDDLEVYHVEFE